MTTIPTQLKESLKNGLVIPFIGAGVSMSVKNKAGDNLFPSWKTLLERAATLLKDDGKSDDADMVNILVRKNRFLEAATEAKKALNANWSPFLKKQFDLSSTNVEPVSLELAKRVWQLSSNLVITTNYDHVLRWACPQNHDLAQWDIEAPAEQYSLLRNGVNKPTVWHLHGQIDNAAEIILTPDGYSKLYSEDKSEQKYQAALHTLQNQLSSRTFIFIGFSLADEDFVNQIKLLDEVFQGATGTHYVLLPESQRATFTPPVQCIEAIYFENFGEPQLALLNKLASFAKTSSVPAIAVGADEVGDYSPDKPVFSVPFDSKGKQMIGREDVLKKVHQQLWSGKRTSIGQTASFQGLGGLGKTQLAVEYAYTYRNEYPNGVIWIHADQDIFAQLIQLAEKASWVSPLSDHAFKLTTSIKRLREVPDCLIIFDNLEDQKDIEEILPATHIRSHILVTSRYEQAGFPPIDLDTLTPELGLQLLLQEAERHPQDEVEYKAAVNIVQRLDGLPLALELAGAYLRRRASVGWSQYLELLQDDLKAAFPVSLHKESLTRHEADIYRTLKTHEILFSEEPLLKDILDVLTWSGSATMSVSLLLTLLSQDKLSSLTGALSLGCALRILQRSNNGESYAIHRLVREVRRIEFPLMERIEWVETCAQRLGNWFEKYRENFHYLPLFEANLDHLKTWQKQTQDLNFLLLASRLLWLQAYPAWHWGRYEESKQYLNQAQNLYAQSETEDIALKSHFFNDFGSVTSRLGDYKNALVFSIKALNLRKSLLGEEHSDTVTSLGNVAGYYNSLGKSDKALELGEQALQIRRKLLGEEHPNTAISLGNVAGYYNSLGKSDKALELGEQALQIHSKLLGEDHPDTATSLGNVASYYNSLGKSDKALELGEQALQIRRKLLGEEHPDTATSLGNVADYYNSLGKSDKALELGEQALQIRRKLLGEEHPDTANSLGNVASYYYSLGKFDKALELGEQTLQIHRKLFGEEHPHTTVLLGNVIHYLIRNNQKTEALNRLDLQLKLLKKDHPQYKKFTRLREKLLSKPIRNGFRQEPKNLNKSKPKKRR